MPQQSPETRALWIVRFEISSPEAIHRLLELTTRYHFNTIIPQVRGRGDAWYRSSYEPMAESLECQPAYFDPLEMLVREGHRAGVRVIAWINTYLVWTGETLPKSKQHLVHLHPDWIARNRDNGYQAEVSGHVEGIYVQQSSPEVQDHLFRVYTEAAANYDVDGIHFDYVRYPGEDYDFSDAALSRFNEFLSEKHIELALKSDFARERMLDLIDRNPLVWGDWRREQVTKLVRRIAAGVKSKKPGLEVSASVFPNPEDAYHVRGQDWRHWLKEGYLDALWPMAYSQNTETVEKQIKMAVAASSGHPIYAGLGAWQISAEDCAVKIQRVRQLGVAGISLFSYDRITDSGKSTDYLEHLKATVFTEPVPPM
ncbi:MAG: family 10 glycosylhydrolase [Armatimonadetes bacterium]|nr:family 10 glycosylhydrolase [Armatimonadota bacterium]